MFGSSLLNQNKFYNTENMPVVEITIGGVKIDIPMHFVYLDYLKTSYSAQGNILTLLLYDSVQEIEEMLLNSNLDITLRYSNSPPISLMITSVKPTYGQIVRIDITAVSKGFGITDKIKSRTFKDTTISEIVKKVILENGNWVLGEVEPTNFIYDDEKKHHVEITQSNETDAQFLNRLATIATSSVTNQGDYVVKVVDDPRGTVVSFSTDKNTSSLTSNLQFSLNDVNNAENPRVISWTPDLSLFYTSIATAGEVSMTPTKGTSTPLEPNKAPEFGRELLIGDDGAYYESKAQVLRNRTDKLPFTGSLILNGIDYSIVAFNKSQVVNLLVFTQQNTLHYSSGKYFIQSVRDIINMGACTQELELYRDSMFQSRTGTYGDNPYNPSSLLTPEYDLLR